MAWFDETEFSFFKKTTWGGDHVYQIYEKQQIKFTPGFYQMYLENMIVL